MKILDFDNKQVFNCCKQERNFGSGDGNIFNSFPEKLMQQYEKTIAVLEDEVKLLKGFLWY
jgi:hypothetical protein